MKGGGTRGARSGGEPQRAVEGPKGVPPSVEKRVLPATAELGNQATLALLRSAARQPSAPPEGGAPPLDSHVQAAAAPAMVSRAKQGLSGSLGNRALLHLLEAARTSAEGGEDKGGGEASALEQALAQRAPDGDATIHDVATTAVETRGPGGPLDAGVRARVEAHLGADLSDVRVHGDDGSRTASAAIGARAFTYGRDVFLGPGESDRDLPLMAHELTHVAQQGAAGARAPQRQVQVGDADTPAEQQADQVAQKVAGPDAPEHLITDGPANVSAQMSRDAFMTELKRQVLATASDALGLFWSAAGCPYIERWFAQHEGDDAASIEKYARRYSGVSAPASASDYIAPICGRLGASIKKWRDGGDVGPEAQSMGLGDTSVIPTAPGADGAQRKTADRSVDDTVRELGRGEPLDGGTAARMGGAFGADFADVRVHTGGRAARKAADLGARAFTIGYDVAFGAGEFRPGTPAGDAMLAHELAHVVQQRGADSRARRAPVAAESRAHEADADSATEGVMARLWRSGTEWLQDTRARVVPALKSGYQLQRCSSTEGKKLPTATDPGKLTGATVGYWEAHLTAPFVNDVQSGEIKATRTLKDTPYDNEGAAIAAVKSNGKSGAVSLEGGRYYAYETRSYFNYKETSDSDEFVYTTTLVPRAAPGVVALISDQGIPLRPKTFDPEAKGPQDLVGGEDALKDSADNPFQGYKDALAQGKDLDTVDDDTLLLSFTAAMKDTALLILNRSEAQVKQKQETLKGGAQSVSPDELKTMKSTSTRLEELDNQISEQELIASAYQPRFTMPSYSGDPSMSGQDFGDGLFQAMHTDDWLAAKEKIRNLNQQRLVILANYPLLARVTPSEFNKLSDDQMLAQLNSEMPGILSDIAKTRINVADGEINLWDLDQVVDTTIAGLGVKSEAKRKVIKDKQASERKKKTVKEIIKAVFMIGLGLLAAFVTGPLGVVFAAGAFGLSLYDAIEQTKQYGIQKAASNTALDPSQSLLPPDQVPGWGWLVVAWVGVGIDAAMVAKAVTSVAKAERAMAAAIESLAEENAARLGIPKEELIARLKLAAGQIDPAIQITEGARTVIARRLGVTIEIDAKLGKDVRIYYAVDEATGKVRVIGMRCGSAASVADILGHEEVLGLMRRYEGLTGRVRELIDRFRSLESTLKFKPGSAAYESALEVKKLPNLIKVRTDRLARGGAMTAEVESQLRADVDFLQNELAYHGKIIEQGAEEAGRGFVAASGESTLAAAKKGFPLPDVQKAAVELTAEDVAKSSYYYRLDEGGNPQLVRKVSANAAAQRAELNADGTFKGFAAGGDLTRAEQAEQIVKGFTANNQTEFQALKTAEEAKGNKVVPIKGLAATDKTIGEMVKGTNFRQRLFDILFEALTNKGEQNAAKIANEAADALMARKVTVVQGTDQLRAFGYRGNFLSVTGKTAGEVDDLHHLVPLYLGGDHRIANLIDVAENLHRQLHELIEGVKFGEGVTLAPGSIQRAALDFKQGAAILHPDGTVELRPLGAAVAPPGAPPPTGLPPPTTK